MRAYINMISSAVPTHGLTKEPIGPVGVAIAVENDAREIVRTCLMRVEPDVSWSVDLHWQASYGLRHDDLDGEVGTAAATALAEEAMAGVDCVIAHFARFHVKQLAALVPQVEDVRVQAFCTMAGTTDACRLPSPKGRSFKPPKLTEALEHYTGEPLASVLAMPWRDGMMTTLTAIRRVYWGYNRWGLAPAIAMVPA